MTPEQFEKHKLDNPQLSFTKIKSSFYLSEKTYYDDYGVYYIYKRYFYLKSNNKKCYVDYYIITVNIERYKLCPSSNGYDFRVKNKYLEEIIKNNVPQSIANIE